MIFERKHHHHNMIGKTGSRNSLNWKVPSQKTSHSSSSSHLKYSNYSVVGHRIISNHGSHVRCLHMLRRRKIWMMCLVPLTLLLLVFLCILNLRVSLKIKTPPLYDNNLSLLDTNGHVQNKTTEKIKNKQIVRFKHQNSEDHTWEFNAMRKNSKISTDQSEINDYPGQYQQTYRLTTKQGNKQTTSSTRPRVIFYSQNENPSFSGDYELTHHRIKNNLQGSLENVDSKDSPLNIGSGTSQLTDKKPQESLEDQSMTFNSSCESMKDWQVQYHPTCNVFHEMDLVYWSSWKHPTHNTTYMSFLGEGNFRNAWDINQVIFGGRIHTNKFQKHNASQTIDDSIVFKQWKFEHEFEQKMYELNRADAIVMDKLTFSPHIVEMYGGCGLSLLTEFAAGSLSSSVRKSNSLAKLKLMQKVAEGLAHIHEIDGPNEIPSIIHNDINLGHIVIGKRGVPLFNDFNIAVFRQWDKDTHEPCDFKSQHPSPQWRSPEEIRNYANMTHSKLTEKIDIYALGNVFHRLAVGERPWRKGHGSITTTYEKEIEILKYNGTLPPVPNEIRHSKDPGIQKLLNMSMLCYKFNPDERPTARQIAQNLDAFNKKAAAKIKNLSKNRKKRLPSIKAMNISRNDSVQK